MLKEQSSKNTFYALSADLKARGLDSIAEQITVIDYTGFVELAEKHQVNAWL